MNSDEYLRSLPPTNKHTHITSLLNKISTNKNNFYVHFLELKYKIKCIKNFSTKDKGIANSTPKVHTKSLLYVALVNILKSASPIYIHYTIYYTFEHFRISIVFD